MIVAVALAAEPALADEAKDEARAAFVLGASLVRETKWSEALAAFEKSFALVPHPVTLFNVAACERALGKYTQARRTLLRVRELDSGEVLANEVRADVDAFLVEIAAVVVTVDVHLEPANAVMMMDGRTIAEDAGRAPGASDFRLEIDPGAHVFVIQRSGYADIVQREQFAPGEKTKLDLVLEELPGRLHVSANRAGAAVAVEGLDVGIAPVDLKRPSGRYHVVVRKAGYVTFDATAVVEAGGSTSLDAELALEETPLTKRWWFWATAGAIVLGASAMTYLLTRPEPERPPANGGGLGWVLRVP